MLSDTTKTAADVTKASAEHDLKSNLNAAKSTARRIYDAVSDDLGDYADEADHRVRDLTHKARDRFNDAKGQFNDVTHRLNDQINGKPLPSVVVALGIGLTLGLLLAGSRRRYY